MEQYLSEAISGAYTFVVYLAPGLLAALGLCFFFIKIPQEHSLDSYRRSRRIMAITFVLYGLTILVDDVYSSGMSNDLMLERLVIIAISAFQAFLFTTTLVTLVDMSYFTVKRMMAEGIAMLAFFAVAFGVACTFGGMASAVYIVCMGGYVVLLVRYVHIFRCRYSSYVELMDNYYSADEDRRLLWVKRSFYWSLGIGLLALVYSFVPTPATSLLFMAAAIAYYVFFGIRFVNYTYDFTFYRQVADKTDLCAVGKAQPPTDAEMHMMRHIDTIMHDDKVYRSATLTINVLAAKLGRNQRMVSAVISHCRNTNFKSYINAMRVDEAVRLVSDGWLDTHTIDALATECGFANRVSFYRAFKQQKGVSPTEFLLQKAHNVTTTDLSN